MSGAEVELPTGVYGVVTALSTTPVKGLALLARDAVMLERSGVADNRRFYLVDEHARMLNGKRIGILTTVRAEYDPASERLAMRFPDGAEASGTVELADTVETRFYSRSRTAQLVVGPWSQALSSFTGQRLRLVKADAAHGGVDRGSNGAVTLMSQASVGRLEALVDGQPVDSRRFRMLVEVAGPDAHAEDQWVGRRVRVGAALVAMRGHVGRCIITSQSPDTGLVDLPTLELLEYRRGMATTEELAFGIYGEVLEPGSVRLGDSVTAE